MNFVKTKTEVFDLLDNYINENISKYSFKRNFDFGPSDRTNVSMISPYLSHRIVTEYDVIKRVLEEKSLTSVEKYIQEIFWRLYWRGWLESRPQVWDNFVCELKLIEKDENYNKAISGSTDIECFNDWVAELKKTGYLHNHTRMWFASIWIFTLNLHWQLGAELFLKYLHDGDSASNTLSWRWVAGLQTRGKNYLAKRWNIEKFTNGRYNPDNLNESAEPLEDSRNYAFSKLSYTSPSFESESIVIFDNELNTDLAHVSNYKNAYICLLSNSERQIELSDKNLAYKNDVVDELIKNESFHFSKIKGSDLLSLVKSNEKVHFAYPGVGDNLDFLSSNLSVNSLSFIKRQEDLYCSKFSNKGFFNFKKNIPKIINELDLS